MGKRINVWTVQLIRESAKVYDLEHSIIRSPQDGVDIVNRVLDLEHMPKEHFVIASLSSKNQVIGLHVIHIGSINASVVHPREVFQQAILNNATSIVCFHNHPSGDPTPSREDKDVTRRLVEAGNILGISILDHLVIGSYGRYESLKERGVI